MSTTFLLLIGFAYLCGSIPFGKIVGTIYGIDIQKHGSGNIGFANTVRVLGWKAGLMVLPGDVLKGTIPVLIAQHYLGFDQVLAIALPLD
jgi:glycerol-3-phosphate acyltransferase PlsY